MTVQILTVGSCSHVTQEHRHHVVVSGSYGGNYNAFNAAKHHVRGVIMSDAGRGKDDAGISGLAYLERRGIAAATVSAASAPIGDAAPSWPTASCRRPIRARARRHDRHAAQGFRRRVDAHEALEVTRPQRHRDVP